MQDLTWGRTAAVRVGDTTRDTIEGERGARAAFTDAATEGDMPGD